MEALEITLICKQEKSIKVPEILDELKKEYKGISYKIGDSYSFAPVFDEATIKVMIYAASLSTPLIVAILKSLLEKLHQKDIRTEYKDRYKLATEMIADKSPFICEQTEDTPYFSQYIFKTKYGRFVWEYNKGEVSLKEHMEKK